MRTGAFLIMCNQYQVKFEDLPPINFAEVSDEEGKRIIAKAAKEKKICTSSQQSERQ